ncbi:hypothetical protein [Halobellus marinus]|uniref:hypothetical protein n=1 Tax=Halobellus TaxID=1073986 RepID=UPI0028AEE551|nr:hypothetical protein [Halobellus sp. DFY28]
MDHQHVVGTLPAFVALDSSPVLAGQRRGTSIQLDDTYFTGQLRAFEAFDADSEERSTPGFAERPQDLRESLQRYRQIEIDIDSLTEADLWTASTRFRRELRRIPEIDFLKRQFPGRCFVVPEWLQSGDRLHYGARVYFFGSEESTTPEDVIRENIDGILHDSSQQFERYQGRLHGYPDCCIEFYHERSATAPSPEWRSIEPFADRIADESLGDGIAVSLDEVLPRFSDWEGRYAFFAREFFPEPGCDTARTHGQAIYDELSSAEPVQLIEDHFGLTFGYNYLVARAVHTGGSYRPTPGDLGQEHLMFYLPLRELVTMPRYS